MPVGHAVLVGTLLASLSVDNETPDALCPPAESVQSAILSRVGEVTGGDYVASYRVVRDVATGQSSVHLRLIDAGGTELLKREIPVTGSDCSDVAQAMALILENHFSGFTPSQHEPSASAAADEPTEPPKPAKPTGEQATVIAPPPSPLLAPDEGAENRPKPSKNQFQPWARGALHLDHDQALSLGFAAGLKFDTGSIYLNITGQPAPQRHERVTHTIHSASHTATVGAQFEITFAERLIGAMGTEAGVELQSARVESETFVSTGSNLRLLPTWGVPIGLGYRWNEQFTTGLLGRGTLRVDSRQYGVLLQSGSTQEFDPLPAFRWDGALYVSVGF